MLKPFLALCIYKFFIFIRHRHAEDPPYILCQRTIVTELYWNQMPWYPNKKHQTKDWENDNFEITTHWECWAVRSGQVKLMAKSNIQLFQLNNIWIITSSKNVFPSTSDILLCGWTADTSCGIMEKIILTIRDFGRNISKPGFHKSSTLKLFNVQKLLWALIRFKRDLYHKTVIDCNRYTLYLSVGWHSCN